MIPHEGNERSCTDSAESLQINNQDVPNAVTDNQKRISNTSVTSNSDICRICHDGGTQEELASYCHCTGSMAMVHRSCLEKWLACSNTGSCEICRFKFKLKRKPRSVLQWIKSPKRPTYQRNLFADLACFVILTPIALVSVWLCGRGASHYQNRHFNQWEVAGLVTLAAFVIFVHFSWCGLAFRYHLRIFLKWRIQNQKVTLLSRIRTRSSGSNTASTNNNNICIDLNCKCVALPKMKQTQTCSLPLQPNAACKHNSPKHKKEPRKLITGAIYGINKMPSTDEMCYRNEIVEELCDRDDNGYSLSHGVELGSPPVSAPFRLGRQQCNSSPCAATTNKYFIPSCPKQSQNYAMVDLSDECRNLVQDFDFDKEYIDQDNYVCNGHTGSDCVFVHGPHTVAAAENLGECHKMHLNKNCSYIANSAPKHNIWHSPKPNRRNDLDKGQICNCNRNVYESVSQTRSTHAGSKMHGFSCFENNAERGKELNKICQHSHCVLFEERANPGGSKNCNETNNYFGTCRLHRTKFLSPLQNYVGIRHIKEKKNTSDKPDTKLHSVNKHYSVGSDLVSTCNASSVGNTAVLTQRTSLLNLLRNTGQHTHCGSYLETWV